MLVALVLALVGFVGWLLSLFGLRESATSLLKATPCWRSSSTEANVSLIKDTLWSSAHIAATPTPFARRWEVVAEKPPWLQSGRPRGATPETAGSRLPGLLGAPAWAVASRF